MLRNSVLATLLVLLAIPQVCSTALGQATSVRKVRISVVSMLWSESERTVERVLQYIEEAGRDGADIVCFPQDCVSTDGEPIPGPISNQIAAKAAEWGIYVIANIKERAASKLYHTSFLCDRDGRIIGKYRQTHRMPDEHFDRGDNLPTFKTDFGTIAMKVGTDHYFPEIDRVYSFKGANIIFWSTAPFPLEDEYPIDVAFRRRALDNGIYMACARYACAKHKSYLTNNYDGRILGCPIGRSYVVDPWGHTIADTGYVGGGVATATIYQNRLAVAGKRIPDVNRRGIFHIIGEKIPPPRLKKYSKRRIRVSIIEGHISIDELLEKLDAVGRMGTDIVCLYEFVWLHDENPGAAERGRSNLHHIAQKAKHWRMYIIIAGVLDDISRNSAILFDRDGREVGRYHKIYKTHKQQIVGTDVPVFETDFGKIGIRICADEWSPEIDRCYALQGAEIIFTPTQSWGPYAQYRELRERGRCIDNCVWLVSATHGMSESDHRSFICDPFGVIVARSEYWRNGIVTAVIDLDNKPVRYLRKYKSVKVGGYLPEYQSDRLPLYARDLQKAIFSMRRPELYRIISHPPH